MIKILIVGFAALFPFFGVLADSCFFRAQVLPVGESDNRENALVVSVPARFYFKLKVTEFVSGTPLLELNEELIFYVHSPFLTLGSASENLNKVSEEDYLFLFAKNTSESGAVYYQLVRGEYFFEEHLKNNSKEKQSVKRNE